MLDLLIQAILLTAANFVIVLYLTDVTVDGPFDIFARLRARAGIRLTYVFDIEGEEAELTGSEHDNQFLARLLSCHRCLSPYGAMFLILLSWLIGLFVPAWTFIILWLATTGMTIFVFEYLDL
jgi:hypothetical protein